MRDYLPFKAGVHQIIYSLLSEYKWLELLKNKGKPYELLLDYFIQLGEFESLNEDNYQKLSRQGNTISQKTGVSSSKIRALIFKIYDDLIELNASDPNLFKKPDCFLHSLAFSSPYGTCDWINVWLPYRLQANDFFLFSFIFSKVKESSFYVDNVTVIHQYGEVSIQAFLKAGWTMNTYRKLLVDKLDFAKVLPLNDLFNLSDYELDKKLIEYARKSNLI